MTGAVKIASVFGLAAVGAAISPIVVPPVGSRVVIPSRPVVVQPSSVHISDFEERNPNDDWTTRAIDLSKWSSVDDWRLY